ncbi:MAG: uracil-DNA glycosylase [Gemmatimonadota bacterium]
MSAKERLRAYLEQRRELGESEMMLDALDVDDVMRMLGALRGGDVSAPNAPPPARATQDASTPAPPTTTPPIAAPTPRPVDRSDRVVFGQDADAPPASGDWRAMMRSLEGGASAKPLPPTPVTPAPPASAEATDRTPAAPTRSGTLRIEGLVVPLGLRVERATLTGAAVGAQWQSLSDVTAAIATCAACGLAATATRPVPGTGNPTADVMVVGEAPGEKEDLTGEPFVGPAGELLNKILGAINLSRETVYICNVLKHRPPGNRNPMPEEVRACAPFLQRQVDLVQPKLILAFGTFAAQSLLGTKLAIGKLRQQCHWYQGIPLIATYHPAALLRNDAWKRPTWEDLKLARRILDATIRA